MRILITGTSGFVGGALLAYFKSRGYDVYGLVRRRKHQDHELCVDLACPQEFERLPCMHFDAIIHAAGMVGGPHFSSLIMRVNAEGTRHLVLWAQRSGCRHFVQISSIGVYGFRILGQNRDEISTPRTESPIGMIYMRSKARAEAYIEQSGIPYTILRMPAIIGPHDTFATPAIISSLQSGRIPYAVRRDRKVSILGIRNMVALIERVLTVGPLGGVFNCTDYDVIWEDLISQYAEQLQIVPSWIRHSLLRMLLHPRDRIYQYLMMHSWLGAQFPSKKLWERLGISPLGSWQETVRAAVSAYRMRATTAPTCGVVTTEEHP